MVHKVPGSGLRVQSLEVALGLCFRVLGFGFREHPPRPA